MWATHQVNRFKIGLAQLCHRFRTILSKEKKYEWTKEYENAFKHLRSEKEKITKNAHFDNEAETRVTCDATKEGLGAVLERERMETHRLCITFFKSERRALQPKGAQDQ